MFPNHKNAATGKTTTSTATHGMAMLFDDIYLASNPDSNIIKSDLFIDQYRNFVWLKRLSSLAKTEGDWSQFNQGKLEQSFIIAATSMLFERFIRNVRGSNIANKVWPLKKIKLLSSVHTEVKRLSLFVDNPESDNQIPDFK